jgi:hypothetical protein
MQERTCSAPGCEKKARTDARAAYCSMHHERLRRHGSLDLPFRPGPKLRITTNQGYWALYEPTHPLVMPRTGYVQEHRKVLYEALGPGDQPCHWCGRVVRWFDPFPRGLTVDHLDSDRKNNALANLVPSCLECNSGRERRERTHCSWGHEFTPENTYMQPHEKGWKRRCRACSRRKTAAYLARKKAEKTSA